MPSSLDNTTREAPPASGCRAVAHSNIALAKYWGKRDRERNLPDVPSLSLTLAALTTTTHVKFDPALDVDEFVLNGTTVDAANATKVFALLDRVRAAARLSARARVKSSNDFPTASGLASSASGFAALARASLGAAGLIWAPEAVSALARAASVSAARSVFGGFVTLEAGASAAEPLDVGAEADRLRMVIAVTDAGPKAVGSTAGMLRTQDTSPYYAAWRDEAPRVHRELCSALHKGDLEKLGALMEHSTLLMHASMLTARPAIVYFNAGTLAAMQVVRELRDAGTFAYFTMDAGPHVKVLTLSEHAERVRQRLEALPSVTQVLVSSSGAGARLVEGS